MYNFANIALEARHICLSLKVVFALNAFRRNDVSSLQLSLLYKLQPLRAEIRKTQQVFYLS